MTTTTQVTLFHDERLSGVHPNLILLLKTAIKTAPHPLIVVEGVRSLVRQKELKAKGLSQTLASKHLRQRDGYGHAFDIAPVTSNGQTVLWNDVKAFRATKKHLEATAKQLGIKVRFGCDWDMNGIIDELEIEAYRKKFGKKPFVDYPHVELV